MSHQRTVYVVDPDRASRRVLTAHLARIGVEAWPFAGGAELLAMIDHLGPACILLAMEMAADGLQLLAEIGRRQPGWPVLAMSAAPEIALVVEAMKLGALDFLEKPFEAATLATALMPAFVSLERSLEAGEERRRAGERLERGCPGSHGRGIGCGSATLYRRGPRVH